MEPTIVSPFRRVSRLRRPASLIGKDSRLHVLELSRDEPARVICDVSGDVVYGSELACDGEGGVLFSNGKSVLRSNLRGDISEVLSLEKARIPGVDNPILECQINGPLRCCKESGRVYFTLREGGTGCLPAVDRRVWFCELDVTTQHFSSFPVRFAGGGIAVDGVSRAAYFPGEGCTSRDMAKFRDRVLRQSFCGDRDQSLVVPGCIGCCSLGTDRRHLLCSADCSPDRPITLIDCHRLSPLHICRRGTLQLPLAGYGAVFGMDNTVLFIRNGFSLSRYDMALGEQKSLIKVSRGSREGSREVPRQDEAIGLPGGISVAREWADVPLVDRDTGLVYWRGSVEPSGDFAVIIDLMNDEYMLVASYWRQVALVAPTPNRA